MNESRDIIRHFKMDLLDQRLALCNEKQQAFFHKIFPNGVPEEKLEDALDLIDRTIKKNIKRGSET